MKRGTIYALVLGATLLLLLLVFARSCRMGNDPQSLDDTVYQEELSPEDSLRTPQSEE